MSDQSAEGIRRPVRFGRYQIPIDGTLWLEPNDVVMSARHVDDGTSYPGVWHVIVAEYGEPQAEHSDGGARASDAPDHHDDGQDHEDQDQHPYQRPVDDDLLCDHDQEG